MRIRRILLLACGALCAHAQNSDFGILLGASTPQSTVEVSPSSTVVTRSVEGNLQLNYAWQIRRTRAGDVYVELPLLLGGGDSSRVTTSPGGATVRSSEDIAIYFTPGVRLKVPVHSRVALYGTLGAGLGSFGGRSVNVSRGSATVRSSQRTTTWALGLGAGIDFRLTRLLSLRFEVRDMISGRVAGRRNNVLFQGGIGFHF